MKDTTRQGYIEWLEAKILEHQTEVARLTVARDVILEMPARRIEGAAERAQPRTRRHPTRAQSREVEQHILNQLALIKHPMKPIELINALGIASDKAARRPWYNALSRLEKQGALVRRVLVKGQSAVYALPATSKILPVADTVGG